MISFAFHEKCPNVARVVTCRLGSWDECFRVRSLFLNTQKLCIKELRLLYKEMHSLSKSNQHMYIFFKHVAKYFVSVEFAYSIINAVF